jgi:iron complex outermembrane receptor protein
VRETGRYLTGFCLAALFALLAPFGACAFAQSVEDLQQMSIGDLANIDVSSVTKTTQALSDAPAAIFVISHEDIVRSGATSLPEILRLAPNLQVAQTSASQYVITARGFSGNNTAQNFSNKLLVLIDGRSVYTPLYSGVYWDMQDVMPQDIERIEVISGPGATLWGANAVNGVINIITRGSGQTQGGLVDVETGNLGTSVGVRYGGKIGDAATWRAYARDTIDYDTVTATGARAHDSWSKPQGGFRLDWNASPADTVTVQGDGYRGSEDQVGAPNDDIEGADVLARWSHDWQGGANLQVQAYYDHAGRLSEDGGGSFTVDTYDLDVQHSFSLGSRNQVVWGGGVRVARYDIQGTASLFFAPASATLDLSNLFVQDSLSITDRLKLIVGLKAEDDPYSGISLLPSARLSWKLSERVLVWAAASRAIRAPTPFDRDVMEKAGPTLFLTGYNDFRPETVDAYEIGARLQPIDRLSFSISAYYNVYDDLRSIEIAPITFIPLRWGNGIRGETYGVEAWGDLRVTPWWRLSAGFSALSEHMAFKPGSSGLLGLSQLGDDPPYQASLKSQMNLGHAITLDADLRYADALPKPSVPAYVELNARVGWKVSQRVKLSLSGFNLLHDRHQEFPAPALPVPRGVAAGLQWSF